MSIDIYPNTPTFIEFNDPGAIDAFRRFRVSEPRTIFESKFIYDSGGLYWESLTANGGTATRAANEAAINLAVTSTANSRVVRQTYRYFVYQAGKSLLLVFTGVLETSGGASGIRSRIGYFDDDNDKSVDSGGNGFFFELNGTTASVVKRSYVTGSQVDTTVNQSSWNVDPLDGTGNSGITLDFSKSQIFFVDLQWLGVGTVRMGVVVNGKNYVCHQFHHSNLVATTYMTSANLPLRYEIENTTGGNTGTLKQICSTVISEGGYQPNGPLFSTNVGATTDSVSTTETSVISLRLKTTHNRAAIYPRAVNIFMASTGLVLWRLRHDATFSSAPTGWTSFDTNSAVEYALNGTPSGGPVIDSGYLYATGQFKGSISSVSNSTLLCAANITGTSQILTLTGEAQSGTESISPSISWQEIY